MAVVDVRGPWWVEGEIDDEGHRDYKAIHYVRTDSLLDGPEVVMNAAGLPSVGSTWNFGNDSDLWAHCWPNMTVTPLRPNRRRPTVFYEVEQKFSTRPIKRCQTASVEDPLLEPVKVSGTFVKYTEEATEDRFGRVIRTSSHELISGPQVEFDANRPTIRIEQNVASLGLAAFAQMIDTLNDRIMWGLPRRCIKLDNVPWSRKVYGVCNYYYTRTLEFSIRYETFDRWIMDEGTKVLRGDWDRTSTSATYRKYVEDSDAELDEPMDFVRFKDWNGENCRVILNGAGMPAIQSALTGTGTGAEVGTIPNSPLEKYNESNFLLLGIPTTF